jgi:hypothetical protein
MAEFLRLLNHSDFVSTFEQGLNMTFPGRSTMKMKWDKIPTGAEGDPEQRRTIDNNEIRKCPTFESLGVRGERTGRIAELK